MDKKCNKCKQVKEITYFNKAGVFKNGDIKYTSSCKDCRKQYYCDNKDKIKEVQKKYYYDNKEKILKQIKEYQQTSIKHKKWVKDNKEYLNENAKKWYENNKTKALKNQKKWRSNNKEYFYEWAENNPEKIKSYNKKYSIKKRQEKPWIIAWRNQLYGVLKRLNQSKQSNTMNILGYSDKQLKHHIESLWEEGMNWGNYGKKRGNWEIDHKKPVSKFSWNSEPSLVNSLSNLQPMWVSDNRKKYNKCIK